MGEKKHERKANARQQNGAHARKLAHAAKAQPPIKPIAVPPEQMTHGARNPCGRRRSIARVDTELLEKILAHNVQVAARIRMEHRPQTALSQLPAAA